MYINLLHLPLFNFMYLFFLSFLSSLSSQHFVTFIFIALFPNGHLALVLLSRLCFSYFCSGRYNFLFPLFAGSIYCSLFLLDYFDFAYGCICICVHSVTLFYCYKPLPLCCPFAVLGSFFSVCLFSSFFNFNF